jgi:hypothetical protein
MNVLYTSPIFKQANGSLRQSWIPLRALDTYERRDAAILQLKALGGIDAPDTEETRKLIKVIRATKRKIDREMWFSRSVE